MKTHVVIPNWNSIDSIRSCLDSLLAQTEPAEIIVVDNGSTDGSKELVETDYPTVTLIVHEQNLGFTGGVNAGITHAIDAGATFVALFNDDAVAKAGWLGHLVAAMEADQSIGIATSKIVATNGTIDSTGEGFSRWGLPFPRGRGEADSGQYDDANIIFGASGGASIYRVEMLKQCGGFDDDFFAYYEDVDLSFRAQLAGWKVIFVPAARLTHQIGAASSRMTGFTTKQTMKNLPWILVKNLPARYFLAVWPRFSLAYILFIASAFQQKKARYAVLGAIQSIAKLPKKMWQRRTIMRTKTVAPHYIWSMMSPDLPPNAVRLRALQRRWHKITGKY